MHPRIKKHLLYYFFLIFILAAGVMLGFRTTYNRTFQIEILVMTSLAYIVWGIFHHVLHHDITLKIVIEYVLIGILGITVVLFLLKGGF